MFWIWSNMCGVWLSNIITSVCLTLNTKNNTTCLLEKYLKNKHKSWPRSDALKWLKMARSIRSTNIGDHIVFRNQLPTFLAKADVPYSTILRQVSLRQVIVQETEHFCTFGFQSISSLCTDIALAGNAIRHNWEGVSGNFCQSGQFSTTRRGGLLSPCLNLLFLPIRIGWAF